MHEMARQPPTDEQNDDDQEGEEYAMEARLNLEESDQGSRFRVYLSEATEIAGIPPKNYVEVLLDDDPGMPVPMIVLGDIGSEEPGPGGRTRRVSAERSINLPSELLEGDEDDPEVGASLGLDRDDYDQDNRLVFGVEAVEGVIALTPHRYEGGSEYTRESPRPEADDVGSLQEAGLVVSDESLSIAANQHSLSIDDVEAACRSIEQEIGEPTISEHELDVDRLGTLDRVAIFVREDFWSTDAVYAAVDDAGLEGDLDALVAAARSAHELTAEEVIVDEGARDRRHDLREHSAITTQ